MGSLARRPFTPRRACEPRTAAGDVGTHFADATLGPLAPPAALRPQLPAPGHSLPRLRSPTGVEVATTSPSPHLVSSSPGANLPPSGGRAGPQVRRQRAQELLDRMLGRARHDHLGPPLRFRPGAALPVGGAPRGALQIHTPPRQEQNSAALPFARASHTFCAGSSHLVRRVFTPCVPGLHASCIGRDCPAAQGPGTASRFPPVYMSTRPEMRAQPVRWFQFPSIRRKSSSRRIATLLIPSFRHRPSFQVSATLLYAHDAVCGSPPPRGIDAAEESPIKPAGASSGTPAPSSPK